MTSDGAPTKTVVVVADLIDEAGSSIPMDRRRDLEGTPRVVLDQFLDAIRRAGYAAVHYSSPAQLAENASRHRDHVVWSIYGGAASKSRMALVPAICEAYGLPFIGPDAYGRIICQDKEVSKLLARDAGLQVGQHFVVRDHAQIERLTTLPWPAVVKPIMEGSSIGIGRFSIVRTDADARAVAAELFDVFKQPILIEEFISGREVCYCFIENQDATNAMSFVELVFPDAPEHFLTHVYDATEKSLEQSAREYRAIHWDHQSDDSNAIHTLLSWLRPLGYGRVDGRLRDGRFVFLEITPDAFVGEDGAFVSGFKQNGWSFEQVIKAVLASVPAIRRDQSSSG